MRLPALARRSRPLARPPLPVAFVQHLPALLQSLPLLPFLLESGKLRGIARRGRHPRMATAEKGEVADVLEPGEVDFALGVR